MDIFLPCEFNDLAFQFVLQNLDVHLQTIFEKQIEDILLSSYLDQSKASMKQNSNLLFCFVFFFIFWNSLLNMLSSDINTKGSTVTNCDPLKHIEFNPLVSLFFFSPGLRSCYRIINMKCFNKKLSHKYF